MAIVVAIFLCILGILAAYFAASAAIKMAEGIKNICSLRRNGVKKTARMRFLFLFIILSILLVVGAFDLDHYNRDIEDWYYPLLRLTSSAACVFSAVKFKTEWARWIFGTIAVLYNPLIPMNLGDHAWPYVNISTVVYMWLALIIEARSEKKTN